MKNKLQVFTKTESKSIPANMVLIKDPLGWLWLSNVEAQWLTNYTNDFAGCADDVNEKAIKAIVKAAKINMKIKENGNELPKY